MYFQKPGPEALRLRPAIRRFDQARSETAEQNDWPSFIGIDVDNSCADARSDSCTNAHSYQGCSFGRLWDYAVYPECIRPIDVHRTLAAIQCQCCVRDAA